MCATDQNKIMPAGAFCFVCICFVVDFSEGFFNHVYQQGFERGK